MSCPAPNELVDFLTRYQLLSHSHLEALAREAGKYKSASEITEDLVQRGLLTKYQQSHLLTGQGDKLVLGPYRLIEPLGEGGMGMVVKGWHPRLDRYAAIKLIRPQVLASRPEIVTRFHREAKAIAQLHHPNVVMLYDADEVNDTHYIAMEFVDGPTLEKMVRQNGPMSIKQSCDYMRQAALGLQHASECGLVHRDIKPSNILVTTKGIGNNKRSSTQIKRPALVTIRDRELAVESTVNGRPDQAWGVVKILDMGLARLQESLEEDSNADQGTPLTRAGALLGTPDFIAPEQARDARSVDIRADLYSLGCTFYYVLTGRPPYPGGNDVQKLIKHQTERAVPIEDLRPHVPTAVTRVVERLMAKRPEDRFQTPQALADELAAYLASTLSNQTPPRGISTEGHVPPSPLPRSPVADAMPMGGPEILAGFDSEMESAREGDSSTSMGSDVPPSNEVRPITVVASNTGVTSAVALSGDGRYVASGGVDGRIRVWDLSQSPLKEIAALSRPGAEIQSVAFAPDDPDYLVFGSTHQGNARIQRWDWRENRIYDWGGFATTDRRGIGAMTFATNGSMFAVAVGSFAVVWKVNKRNASGQNILKGHGYPLRSLAFSPDNRLIATAGESRSVRLWGFGWLGTSLKATIDAHADNLTSIAFSPDGKKLATAGFDRNLVLWDPLTPSTKTAITLTGHSGNIRHVHFNPNGKQLISVGETGQVLIWDLALSQVLRELTLDLSMAYSVAVTPDGRRLVAGYSNGQIAIFDLNTNPATPTIANVLAGARR